MSYTIVTIHICNHYLQLNVYNKYFYTCKLSSVSLPAPNTCCVLIHNTSIEHHLSMTHANIQRFGYPVSVSIPKYFKNLSKTTSFLTLLMIWESLLGDMAAAHENSWLHLHKGKFKTKSCVGQGVWIKRKIWIYWIKWIPLPS